MGGLPQEHHGHDEGNISKIMLILRILKFPILNRHNCTTVEEKCDLLFDNANIDGDVDDDGDDDDDDCLQEGWK